MTLTYASLFSGIGGFDLGFDRAGMSGMLQVENDAAARSVLERHWPAVSRMEDVRDVRDVSADVVCGGFPCQDVSVAGRRAGLAGERSGLWFEFHRIIERNQPRWVVIENVPGLLSSHGGRDFATILRGLVECGYGIAWRILDAQYFGVAQRRRRVFIVGSLGDGRSAEVLFERDGRGWDTTPRRETRPDVTAYAVRQSQTGSNGWGIDEDRFGTLDGAQSWAVAHALTAEGHDASEDGTGRGTPLVAAPRVARQAKGGFTDPVSDNIIAVAVDERHSRTTPISGTLQAKKTGGWSMAYQNPVFIQKDGADDNDAQGEHLVMAFSAGNSKDSRGIGLTHDGTPPLRAGASGTNQTPTISYRHGVRRLTPVECERLQGFPDNWTTGQSDSARYRQLGNAVAVPVAEWLGRRIVEATE